MKYQRTPGAKITSQPAPNASVVGKPWANVTDVLRHHTDACPQRLLGDAHVDVVNARRGGCACRSGWGAVGVGVGVGVGDGVAFVVIASVPMCSALASVSCEALLHPTSEVSTSAAPTIATPLALPDMDFSN
jgi:hypothetical protein